MTKVSGLSAAENFEASDEVLQTLAKDGKANLCNVCIEECTHIALSKPSLVKKVQLSVQKGYRKLFYETIRMISSSAFQERLQHFLESREVP